MENEKPKEVKPPVVHTDGPGDPPKCPEGYVWDDKAQACVLDVG